MQLQNYLSTNCISDVFQSALLKAFNDILITTDSGNIIALVLLDLSSAFGVWSSVLVFEELYLTGFGPFCLIEGFHQCWEAFFFCSTFYMWCFSGINFGAVIVLAVHVTLRFDL